MDDTPMVTDGIDVMIVTSHVYCNTFAVLAACM